MQAPLLAKVVGVGGSDSDGYVINCELNTLTRDVFWCGPNPPQMGDIIVGFVRVDERGDALLVAYGKDPILAPENPGDPPPTAPEGVTCWC